MQKSLQVITLGCSKNTVDTERLLSRLEGVYTILPEGHTGPADILLVNTCGFIGDAKEESIQAILSAAGRKTSGDVGRLLVFGCLSQRYMSQLPGLIPEVDGWFGARDLEPLVKALGGAPSAGPGRFRTDTHAYAYLKISEGCDRRCAYCAIPFIRGPHKSVPMEDLVREAGILAAGGVKELILVAQETTVYGVDLYGSKSLHILLNKLSKNTILLFYRTMYFYHKKPLDWTRGHFCQSRRLLTSIKAFLMH